MTPRHRLIPPLLAVVYLSIVQATIGLRWEHWTLLCMLLGGTYAHPRSRSLVLALLPFALFGIVYDMLRLIPPDFIGRVWIAEPYHWEEILFGLRSDGKILLPHQFLQRFVSLPLDLFAGFIYSLHILIPIAITVLLWFKRNPRVKGYAYAFLAINLVSFITYVVFPVAPPWYVETYGFSFHPAVAGSAAGLIRVDHWLNAPYFQNIYGHGAWVFGAIPSMHAGFPLLTLLFVRSIWKGRPLLQIPFYVVMFSVWFCAVYLEQHYVIDIIAGIVYAAATFKVITHFSCKLETSRE